MYAKKFDDKLEDFKEDLKQRRLISGVRFERSHSVAALNEVEAKLSEAAGSIRNVSHR